jgi:uncharacterized damage-inducible protein DinB
MMVDVSELLEYNAEVRRRYFAALAKFPWEEFVKDREASWHSLRNVFIHTLGAVDYWLDFLQGEKLRVSKKFDDYKTIGEVQEYMEHVEDRMRRYLGSTRSGGFMRKYPLTNDAGRDVEVTAEDILIHVFEEEVHHRGELIALLWQMDVEPPLMGWKFL